MSPNYHPDLQTPAQMPQVDLESPLIQPIIQGRSLFNKAKVDMMQVPPAFNLREFRINRNGRSFTCYCIEPKGELNKLPAILYFHGGGFVLPLQPPMMEKAVYFAEHLHCRVFLPEYALTTVEPFPAALADGQAALQFILGHQDYLKVDTEKILFYGESAGGCLAASLLRLYLDQQDAKGVAGMVLVYPVLDNTMNYPSMSKFKDGVFSATPNYSMWSMYLDMDLANHPWADYAVPAQNRDFSAFPPVYVEAAEKDILRDEARAYAARMEAAGVPVKMEVVTGAYHAYDNDHSSPLVQRVLAERLQWMRQILAGIGQESREEE